MYIIYMKFYNTLKRQYMRILNCRHGISGLFGSNPFGMAAVVMLIETCHVCVIPDQTLIEKTADISPNLDHDETTELLGVSSGSKLFAYGTTVAIGRIRV